MRSTAEVRDVTGRPDNTQWRVYTPDPVRGGEDIGSIITSRPRIIQPLDGVIDVDLEPGLAVIEFGTNKWLVNIPTDDTPLWTIIASAVAFPPDVSAAAIGAAVQAWLDANPITGGSGPDNTDELPEGSTNRYFTNARADDRITAANLVPKAATSTSGFGFVDDDDTLAANSATKLATQRAVRAYVIAKIAELIGAAPAELDTWLELVAAIQDNGDALAGIATALADRLLTADAPELIRDTIAAALVAGTNVTVTPDDGANTITIDSIGGGTEPLVYDSVTGWPSRPAVSYPVFWIGGAAPEDAPSALVANDVWIPETGDNIDLGTIVEAFQLIAGTANTIPYLSAPNTFGNLVLKTAADAYSDTAVLTEAATRDLVDKLPTQAAKTGDYTLQATDRNTCLEYDNTTAATFTIDNVFAAGDIVTFRSINTGLLTIAAGSGVTLSVFGGSTFKLGGQWAEASIHFRTATHAILTGSLTA
ncbi:MAG: hypothetical protein U5N53_28245 [Mycobacterium sp.]|nr:hypothetical protein [Mycobacterium sp.]